VALDSQVEQRTGQRAPYSAEKLGADDRAAEVVDVRPVLKLAAATGLETRFEAFQAAAFDPENEF